MSRKIDPQVAEARMISAGLQPLEPYKNAISDWKCKCLTCKKIVISRYNRIQQGSGCPLCAYRAGGMKIRLSEAKALEKLKEYNLEAIDAYEKSDVKWKCRCLRCGEIVYPKLKNLQRGDGGCYKCGKKIAGEKNKLDENQAVLIASKAGFTPLEPYKNALSKWKMIHLLCGATVYPKLNTLTSIQDGRLGCVVCSGHQVAIGINDLATTHPNIASEAYEWNPTEVTAGSQLRRHWKCSNEHTWIAPISTRTSGHGCPYCTGKKVFVGFNDLLTINPAIAKEAFEWDPSTTTVGSSKRVKWRCEEGHVWVTSVLSRSRGYGCPTCANSGFDPNKDAYIYFLSHPHWQMYQVGITNFPDQRINSHKKLGWKVIELRGPMDGLIAREWETSILRMLKFNKADLSNSKIAGKFDGYSEAWSQSTFQAKSIKELMRLTEEFEENK